jgi:phage gp29-like protein
MLTDNQITQETPNQKLTPEFLEKILKNANHGDLIEIYKWLKNDNE